MKINWKLFFGISIILLITSNLYWMYQILDISVGHTYYKDSCEKYNFDRNQLIEVLLKFEMKEDVINFLSNYEIKYEAFEKGDRYIISLESFQLEYDIFGVFIEKNIF